MNHALDWCRKSFANLSNKELLAILKLRQTVFIIEQTCLYQDIDDYDEIAIHLCGWDEQKQLAAYGRILAPDSRYREASIGRLVTAPKHRGTGLGHQLIQHALAQTQHLFGPTNIRIGAQERLSYFYQKHQFTVDSAPYDEDGIMHIEMLYTAHKN